MNDCHTQATDTRAALEVVGLKDAGLPTDTTEAEYRVDTVGWVRRVGTTDIEVRTDTMGTEYPSGTRGTGRMVVEVQGVVGWDRDAYN